MLVRYFIKRWERQGLEPWEIKERLRVLQKLEGAFLVLILASVVTGLLLYLSDGNLKIPGSSQMEVATKELPGESPWEFVQPLPDTSSDMNLNGDDELTEDEIRKFSSSRKIDPSSTKTQRRADLKALRRMTALAHALRVRDRDKDGFVTLAENYEFLCQFDLNKNGVLEDEEHQAAEMALRLKVPKQINDIRRGLRKNDGNPR
jgi:hypothetical protein